MTVDGEVIKRVNAVSGYPERKFARPIDASAAICKDETRPSVLLSSIESGPPYRLTIGTPREQLLRVSSRYWRQIISRYKSITT